jgi:hypothetical protein
MMCLGDRSTITSTGALSDRSTFTSIGVLDGRHDKSLPLFLEDLLSFQCVCLQELKLSPPLNLFMVSKPAKGCATSTRSKGGGTTARGHHLFPLHVHYYTHVEAIEAPANDIRSRSYLHQEEAIEIVYYVLDEIMGLKLRFDIILTSVFELASVHVLFRQDVKQHQSNC